MSTFITKVKEDEISPYLVCKAQIIRPLDGTTFKDGDSVKVVSLHKFNSDYPVGLPDAIEFTNGHYGTAYEMWIGTDIFTTETQRENNYEGYEYQKYPIFKDMTTEQKRAQVKQRSNHWSHITSQKANRDYAANHNLLLKEFPALMPDPGVDLMKTFHDDQKASLNLVDQVCDSMSPQMAQMLGINVEELRAYNQTKKTEHAEFVKKCPPVYAGSPPFTPKKAPEPTDIFSELDYTD